MCVVCDTDYQNTHRHYDISCGRLGTLPPVSGGFPANVQRLAPLIWTHPDTMVSNHPPKKHCNSDRGPWPPGRLRAGHATPLTLGRAAGGATSVIAAAAAAGCPRTASVACQPPAAAAGKANVHWRAAVVTFVACAPHLRRRGRPEKARSSMHAGLTCLKMCMLCVVCCV